VLPSPTSARQGTNNASLARPNAPPLRHGRYTRVSGWPRGVSIMASAASRPWPRRRPAPLCRAGVSRVHPLRYFPRASPGRTATPAATISWWRSVVTAGASARAAAAGAWPTSPRIWSRMSCHDAPLGSAACVVVSRKGLAYAFLAARLRRCAVMRRTAASSRSSQYTSRWVPKSARDPVTRPRSIQK